MEKHRLTTFIIAVKNLNKRAFRTKSLILIVAVFSFSIFCGLILSQSLSLGINYMSGLMGADIMVVPRGCASRLQDTLLRSKSNTFYLNENLTKEISNITGVEQVSPQLYIASLNASCCSVPVQLIGFDPETDFTIKSWMTNINSSKLDYGEVVTGCLINADVGDQLLFYGQPLNVVATLSDLGMGFNSAIFMTLETAQHMIRISEQKAVHPAGNVESQISALFIKLSDNSDISKTSESIIGLYPQTDAVITNDMMKQAASHLNNIKGLIYGLAVLLWIVSIMFLSVVVIFTVNERRHELGLYLALGAKRRKVTSILLTETLIICLSGAICGVIAGCLIMFEFLMLIATSLGLPFLKPTAITTAILILVSLLMSVITGILPSVYASKRISLLEPYLNIREYE